MYGKHTLIAELKSGRPWAFLGVFLVVFFALSVVLYAFDFVPEPQSGSTQAASAGELHIPEASEEAQVQGEAPVRIVIAKAKIDVAISNPATTSISVLDNALLTGAVRYPDSGFLGQNSRMLLFGHQSHLPVVHNQAFKAFNNLQMVTEGDDVIVFSATAKYRYRVTSVEHVNVGAEDALVELGDGAKTLTLITCDSFGKKTDRYEVKADFVGKEPLT